MKLSLILEAIDRMTAPVRKATGAVSGLTSATKRATGPMARLSSLVQRTAVDHERLGRMATRTGQAIGTGLRRIGIGMIFAAGALSTLPIAFASAVFKAGMHFDKGFAAKVTAVTAKLQASFASFLVKIGNAGVFDMIVAKLQAVSGWVDRMAANGSLDRWAKQIGQALTNLGNWLGTIDWIGVASDIFGIAKAIFAVGQFLANIGGGGLAGLFNVGIVAVIAKMSVGLYSLGAALGVVSIAGAPLWAVVGVIGALAAGAFLVWRNWDSVKAGIAGAWDWIKTKAGEAVEGIVSFFSGMWGGIKSAFAAGVQMLWNTLPAWFRGIISGTAFVVRTVTSAIGNLAPQAGPSNRPARGATPHTAPQVPMRSLKAGPTLKMAPPLKHGPPLASAAPKKGRPEQGGTAMVKVHVTTDKGLTARPTKVAAKGMHAEVNVGRAMGHFA
ncbi:MAG: hypothetical protein ABW048_14495 [Sphingobium sp.]